MKAVILQESGSTVLANIPLGILPKQWSRIRVVQSGLCGTDVAKIFSSVLPENHTKLLGHEFVGQIEDPNGNTAVSRGDWVVGMPLIPCGACEYCRQQHQNLCVKADAIGRTINGSFAEYVDVPFNSLVRIDDFHEAYVLSDPLAVCIHAASDVISNFNQKCLVIGDGTIGCMLAWFLHFNGCETWIKGLHQKQLCFMQKQGINVIHADAHIPNSFFDRVYETVGRTQSDTLRECLYAVCPSGHIIVLGVFSPDHIFPLNTRSLFIKEVQLFGANAYVPSEFHQAVSIIKENKDFMTNFISHRFPLSQFQDAVYAAKIKHNFTMKIVLEIGGIP